MLKPAIFGAYTELWAGFSPLVTTEQDGQFIVPWGRFGTLPPNIEKGLRTTNYGGPGLAEQFSAWCQKETKPYM
jgi:retinol dehydrogenase-12